MPSPRDWEKRGLFFAFAFAVVMLVVLCVCL